MADRTGALIQRIQNGVKQSADVKVKIAARLSVDRQTVNEWIKRRRKPTSEQALALLEFMDSQKEDGPEKPGNPHVPA